jgi:hypothetical protein
MALTANRETGAALTDIAMGYFRSRVLGAAARLGVADSLGDAVRPVDELAGACGADAGSLHRLLRALASFGVVVETSPGRFALTEVGKPLRRDHPESEWPSVVFWADLLADGWSYLTECVRTGQTAMRVMPEGSSRWSKDPEAGAIFRAVMGTAPAEDYMPIVRAWDFSSYSSVADLGGGGGALIAAVLEAYPRVQGMLVDRREAVDQAASRFETEALAGRCKLLAADLCKEVPPGAEVYMMQHVLHAYNDAAAGGILRNCRQVVPCGGRLLVIEGVLPDVVDGVDQDLESWLMSDLNMLAITGGRERSAIEWRNLLERAGFECRRIIPIPENRGSILEAA